MGIGGGAGLALVSSAEESLQPSALSPGEQDRLPSNRKKTKSMCTALRSMIRPLIPGGSARPSAVRRTNFGPTVFYQQCLAIQWGSESSKRQYSRSAQRAALGRWPGSRSSRAPRLRATPPAHLSATRTRYIPAARREKDTELSSKRKDD